MTNKSKKCRHLVLVLGDQLNHNSAALRRLDPQRDQVWMVEVAAEVTHVWNHKARIVMFLAAMRHFRDELADRGIAVDYRQLDHSGNRGSFGEELKTAVRKHRPGKLVVVHPGEWRVLEELRQAAGEMDVTLEVLSDDHFFSTPEQFAEHAAGRKQLRLEYFYRELRKRTEILVDRNKPEGGKWNYDADNRHSFPQEGPGDLPAPVSFPPDMTTKEVIELVQRRFADHPGNLDKFDWPVTHKQAAQALDDFVDNRLAMFGKYQDALWQGEPYLYHSRLAAAMNLKLLDPRDVVDRAQAAYRAGHAPLNSVEGFVRQILGWREYVRGVYWHFMPEYLERNDLQADHPLPHFYWTGETEMNCLRESIGQTLDYGFAHHIQRLMVTGLFALLLGVDPKKVHEWYLAVYVDAVEWVELPNVLGMSQFGDGGVMASKPYAATGKYIQRMSNYCTGCRFNPAKATGEDACPFTTLYWDFLWRHEDRLAKDQRMSLQVKNLERKSAGEKKEIRKTAEGLRDDLA